MIRYERPLEPNGFAGAVNAQQQKLQDAIDNNGLVIDAAAWPKLKVSSTWSNYKDDFNDAQFSKCAYCERKYTGYGDVEHFKPKKMVTRLDAHGVELPTLRVENRTPKDSVVPGYWWLAYSWSNYLFACNHCNSKWKLNHVAVEPVHSANDVPRQQRQEEFLLLHPYDDDPEIHIAVDDQGFMLALDGRGRSSIDVFGLNRPSLIDARRDAYRNLRSLAGDYLEGDIDEDELIDALHPRRRFGAARRSGAAAGLGGADPMTTVMGLVDAAIAAGPPPI